MVQSFDSQGAVAGIGARFQEERERLGLSRVEVASSVGYSAEQVRVIEAGRKQPGALLVSALGRLGGDVGYVLVARRTAVDPQRLAWICHAIEAAVDEQVRVKGHANPRVLGLIYNKVLSYGSGSDDDIKLAKAEVATYLESLRAADMSDGEIATRVLRIDQNETSEVESFGRSPRMVKVTGDANQVAGRDIHAAPKIKKQK
jgi:transcriptional regulator with XRE-family HTH domain